MLFYHLNDVAICLGVLWLFFLLIGFTAYQVNSRRPAKDPKKRDLHPFAVLLAPFLFLVLAPLGVVLFLMAVTLYAGFILLFVIMLVGWRKPFLFAMWTKFSTFVGEPLLRIGTYLIMLPFRLINPRLVQQPAAA